MKLVLTTPLRADEGEKVPNLQEAQTIEEIKACVLYEQKKLLELKSGMRNPETGIIQRKPYNTALATLHFAAHEKAMKIAQTDAEKVYAYRLKYLALRHLVKAEGRAGNKEAEQETEKLLNELANKKEFKEFVNYSRFELFSEKNLETIRTLDDFNTFKAELMPWFNLYDILGESISRHGFRVARQCKYPLEQFAQELKTFVQSKECILPAREKTWAMQSIERNALEFQFYVFEDKSNETVNTPESFSLFKTELKTWVNKFRILSVLSLGLTIADKNNVSAQEFVAEMTAFIQSSDCTLSEESKAEVVATLEGMIRRAQGSDPKLYGKMLDGSDFNWESLRGKYVLIKFTATWCGPCKGEIPGMLEAYKKYHDKGLEIVSVYIWDHGDAVATIKKAVEQEKLPWIILSEALTVEESNKDSGIQKQGKFYAIKGVPTMLLCDKEGTIIMTGARGERLQSKLAEIFE
jgi:thiol-disulfide isomerase/thioredoxin